MISWTSLFDQLKPFSEAVKTGKANSRLSLDVIPASYSNITTLFYKGGNNQFIQGATFLHQNLAKRFASKLHCTVKRHLFLDIRN